MTIEGMGLPVAVKGATTEGVFEAYVEIILSPMLCPGQAVVMDNLTAHRGDDLADCAATHLLKRLS
jgi:hypothetical protein